MNMDSIRTFPNHKVFRGSSELDRLRRINAAPYDDPIQPRSQQSAANSKRLLGYIKDKMSGAISSLKSFFQDSQKPSLESIPLTQSFQLPAFSQEKLNNLSSSIQQTISKPEFQDRYTAGSERQSETKRSSLMNMVDYYKDVSTEKVRETMKKQNSNIIPQGVDCQRRPVPLYTQKNTTIEETRSSQGKDKLNKNGKRGLRSILFPGEKNNKGNKKVSFVPELRRSTSSIIKYNSSDDEDSIYIQDTTQKKIFIDDKVILKNEPTIQISLIKAKKLNPNPFHQKRLIEKAAKSKACLNEKTMKKKFSDEFGKYNKGNSFGSDNLINDSKVETDSDDSGFVYNNTSFESHNFQILKSLENKKNQRNRKESSSDQAEKEDQTLSIASSQKMNSPKISVEEEEESPFVEESPQQEKKEVQKMIETEVPKKQEDKKEQTLNLQNKSPLFQNLQAPKEIKEVKSPAVEPIKPRGSLISLIMQDSSEENKTLVHEQKALFSSLFGNSQSITQEKPKEEKIAESTQSKLPFASNIGGSQPSRENIEEIKTPAKTTSLFSNGASSLFGPKTEQQNVPVTPISNQTDKKEETTSTAPLLTKAVSKPETDAPTNSLFASYLNTNIPSHSENPFLKAASQKSISFTDLIASGSNTSANAALEKKPETQGTQSSSQAGGILELFQSSQSSSKPEMGLKRTLTQNTGEFSWLNNNADSKQPNLFSNLSNSSATQSSLFQQAPAENSLSFLSSNQNNNNNNGGGLTGMLLGGNNNSAPSNSLFGGNNNLGGGILGGGSSQNGGMGLFAGNNNSENNSFSSGNLVNSNNPFLSQGSFGGNSGGFGSDNGLSRSGSFMGSGQKKKNHKERAF